MKRHKVSFMIRWMSNKFERNVFSMTLIQYISLFNRASLTRKGVSTLMKVFDIKIFIGIKLGVFIFISILFSKLWMKYPLSMDSRE